MRGLQRPEQCVIFQPMSMEVAELLIRRPQIPPRPGAEGGPSGLEQPVLERDDSVIIDGSCRERVAGAVACPQQSVLDQAVWADQEFVCGEGRQGLIRGVDVPRRTR